MLSGVERAHRMVRAFSPKVPLRFAFQPDCRRQAESFDPGRPRVHRRGPLPIGQCRTRLIFPACDGPFWTCDAQAENTAAFTPDDFLIGRVGWN